MPGQWQYRGLHRRQPRVEPQHGPFVNAAFGVGRFVLRQALIKDAINQRVNPVPARLRRGIMGVVGLVEERQVSPECFACVDKSKSVRLATPSSITRRVT